MATTATGAGPGAAQQQQAQGGGGLWSIVQSISRMILIYYGIQYAIGAFKQQSGAGTAGGGVQEQSDDPATGQAAPAGVAAPANYMPLWNKIGISTDLHVYISEDALFDDFDDSTKLVWKETGIIYGDKGDVRGKETTINISSRVQNNGSLYAHVYLTGNGRSPNPVSKTYSEVGTLYTRKLLSRYMKKKKLVVKKKLVKKSDAKEDVQETDDAAEEEESSSKDRPIISYWWSNLTISVVPEANPVPSKLPPAVAQKIRVHKDGVHFYPIFEVNDFWMLSENLMPINETTPTLNVSLAYQPLSFWYYQTLIQFGESFKMQNEVMGVEQRETDEIKRMFLETNPVLLAVTMFVSVLHSIFDFLAFKNDVAFWKDKKDMDGLSFRTILMNVVFQLIIFLYLLDNETSWMIIISTGVGLLIEMWKINKTVIVKPKSEFPFIEFIDKYKPSKTARKTMKYDKMAFSYLSYFIFPLLVGYTIYSLYYEEHKSWYSFIVGTLVGFVYTFGFISMTPQLFINYKLKSVAHMPWKTFIYKALNTFIDDLFAFIIKMPWLHRLACLRDDLIFLIYLYQRWVYPEDKKRRNEFGQVGEGPDEDEDDGDDSDDETTAAAKKDSAAAKSAKDEKPEVVSGGIAKSEESEVRSRKGAGAEKEKGSPGKGASGGSSEKKKGK